jgi:shikimate kinase
MGTGKSTVGMIVAELLDMPFVDTDIAIEERVGQRIPEIFASSGEAVFRKLESVICLEAAIYGGMVIATGGGALLNANTREALEGSGMLICLDADLDEIVQRIGSAEHPPLAVLYESQAKIYDNLPNHVDTTGKSPGEVAAEVITLWQSAN